MVRLLLILLATRLDLFVSLQLQSRNAIGMREGEIHFLSTEHWTSALRSGIVSYLSRVYPLSANHFSQASDKDLRAFLRSLHLFYLTGLEQHVELAAYFKDLLHCPGLSAGTAAKDLFQNLIGEGTGDEIRQSVLAQGAQVIDSKSESTLTHEWAYLRDLPVGAHLEVTHFRGQGKYPRDQSRPFLDPGKALAWYFVRKGSGIFYNVGRAKTAANKNQMLLLLLEELNDQDQLGHRFDELFQDFGRRNVLQALKSTLAMRPAERSTCDEVGLHCWGSYQLSDDYDESMIWIARALHYDTLIFAASYIGERYFIQELVDVRLPEKQWFDAALDRKYLFDGEGSLNEWLSFVQKSEVLSVRDAYAPSVNSTSISCQFQVSGHMELYCAGTLSEEFSAMNYC